MSSTTSELLPGIRSKIEWAKKHVNQLQTAIAAFLDAYPRPYEVATKRNAQTGQLIYYVSHVTDVPCDLPHLAGDTFGTLVSILDHLAFRLFKKYSPTGDGRRVYFPIDGKAKTAAEYIASVQRKVQGIEPTVVIPDLLSVEAYEGGKGHDLWMLNELNNLAKHRELVTVGSRFRSFDVGAHMAPMIRAMFGVDLPMPAVFLRPAAPLCPLKVGDQLLTDSPDAEPNPDLKFKFDVAISEPQIVKPQPLIEMVHQLAGVVESIVNRFSQYL